MTAASWNYENVVALFDRHHPSFLRIRLWPNAVLTRGQDALRVQRVLDRLVQLHLRVVVEVVRLSNLVHERKMCSILAPAFRRTVFDQGSDEPMRPPLRVRVCPVEHNAHDVMHLAHSYDKGSDEIEACFLASLLGDGVLLVGVKAGDLGNG